MLNGDKLEPWYSCPYCGHEGFKSDMAHVPESSECSEYLKQIGIGEGMDGLGTNDEAPDH